MGFTSLDDLTQEITSGKIQTTDWNKITGAVAYTAGNWYDLSSLAGTPVANAWTGTALNSQVPTESTGFGIYHGGNVSTDTKHLLNMGAYSAVATAVPGVLMLVDMCMYYPGINMLLNTAQTLTTGTALSRYTSGNGLRAFIVSTALTGTSAGTPVFTMSYTNQAGTAGRSLGATVNFTAGAANVPTPAKICHSGLAANNFGPFLPLQAGDTGIRSVQSVQLTTAYTGATTATAALVICKPLARLPIVATSVASERNLLTQLPSLPKIEDGACLTWLYFPGAATAANTSVFGYIDAAWG